MAKNENKEKTGKFTKHDLWCIIVGAICAFCWAFFRGRGWLDWLYNLAPKLETEVVESIVVFGLLGMQVEFQSLTPGSSPKR